MTSPTGHPPRGVVRRWTLRAVFLLVLTATTLLFFHHPLLVLFATAFRVNDPAPSDALVLLLGQWDSRPVVAANLYLKGVAPVILMGSTSPFPEPDLCESALNQTVLVRSGVPADAVRVLSESGYVTSTRDEALRVRDYIRTHPVRRITVVTTSFHTARARWIFRKVLADTGVEIRIAAAPDPRFDESNWYRDIDGLIEYSQETLKTIAYRLAYGFAR